MSSATSPDGWDTVALARIAVNGQDLKAIRLTAGPMVHASGRITLDPSSGPLPSGRIYVGARSIDPFIHWPYPGQELSADRTFEVRVPPAVATVLPFSLPSPWIVKAVRANGVDVTDSGIDFSSGRPVSDIEIEVTNRRPTLSGVVRGERGEPMGDYMVVIFPEDRQRQNVNARSTNQRYFLTARPDQNGRYIERLQAPGSYFAIAVPSLAPHEIADPALLAQFEDAAIRVTLLEGEAKTLDLKLHQR